MGREIKAVCRSQKPVHVGSRLHRSRELFGWDCDFTQMDGSLTITVRIHKDNPVLKTLRVGEVFLLEDVGHVGFGVMKDIVTDVNSGNFYHIGNPLKKPDPSHDFF